MRLIDADALKIDYGFTWDDITPTHDEMYALIDRQPTIEERKKGEWMCKSTNGEMFDCCSVCGYIEWDEPKNFCPRCGADMRGDGNA